jgi:outer membrane immunogenic protein
LRCTTFIFAVASNDETGFNLTREERMKKLFLMIMVASGLLTQGYARYDNRCMPECCDSFDGLYIGGTVGWAFHDRFWVDRDDWIDSFGPDFQLGSVVSVNDGVELGLQLGYNMQCGCALYGLEFDANWADFQRTTSLSSGDPIRGSELAIKDDTTWFGSIRARAGIVANNLLLFATAGAAWADVKHSWSLEDAFVGESESFSNHTGRWGLAVGAGVEWEFCGNFGFKAEALYHKFPNHSSSFFSPAAGREVSFDLMNEIWVARVGVNYRLRSLFSCFC